VLQFGLPRRIGVVGPLLQQQQLAPQAFFREPRAPIVMNTPRPAGIGFADVAPNLLLTTLAVAAAALPFIPQADASAPRPYPQIQCEQQAPNNLLLGIVGSPLPLPSSAALLGPQQKYEVRFDNPPNLIRHPLPDFLPRGQQLSDSSPPVVKTSVAENPPAVIRRTLPDFLPPGRQVSDSAPPPKFRVTGPILLGQIAAPPNPFPPGVQVSDSAPPPKFRVTGPLLTCQVVQPSGPGPLPIGEQISDSAPPPKFSVGAPLLVGQIVQPAGVPPGPLPIGQQVSNSAPPPKYRPQVDVYPDTLALSIPTQTQTPAWADFDPVPAASRFLPPFDPPNLLLSSLLPAQALAPAWADFDEVPAPSKFLPPFDPPHLILSTLKPPVPPPAIPLGLPVDTAKFMPKFAVMDQNSLWPNSQLPNPIPPPVVPPPTTDTHDGLPKRHDYQVLRESDYKKRLAELRGLKLTRKERQVQRADLEAEFKAKPAALYQDPPEDEDWLIAAIAEEEQLLSELLAEAAALLAKQRMN
jgi:hypothetical protein